MWLMVCTFDTFDTNVTNKIIKIMFNKYFKMPRWHFPNFNKIKIISILKMKNENENIRFSL